MARNKLQEKQLGSGKYGVPRKINGKRNLEWDRRYQKAYRWKKREYDKRWRAANPEKSAGYSRKWKEKLRRDDPERFKKLLALQRDNKRRWTRVNPERVYWASRKSGLKLKYGLTLEDYEALLRSQRGRCAICRVKARSTMHVDHDHSVAKTKIRGLLCGGCNVMLGRAKDSVKTLKRAIVYLEK